jgi:hypothetical protein
MLMKQVPDLVSVREMVDMVQNGQLAIPEFQRPFVWKPPQVADLLVSVARRWPIGTLLLLEGPQDFAVRPLAEAPEVTSATLLLLDGQQRMTALYRALGDHVGDEVYYVDFNALREDNELSDEHIKVRQRKAFVRQYPDVAARARSGYALVGEVADPDQFLEWLRQDPAEMKDFSSLRNSQLAGLQDYSVPAVRLSRDIGFEALAKIFETINRTGVRLATFDLMVARMYPRNFDLRAKWTAAVETHEDLRRFAVEGMEILRLIALRELLREIREQDLRRVKGVRQGDVLGLDAAVVKQDWDASVAAYVAALGLVRKRCGVVNKALMPASTMLLPLAATLADNRAGAEPAAERFFWAAGLAQVYAQGANTQAVRDARELERELEGGEPPEVVCRAEADQELLLDSRRRNEVLLRTLSCLLVRNGARDWLTGQPLIDLEDEPVESMVFPESWLRSRGIVPDGLLNWTVQSKETDAQLAEMEPSQLVSRGDLVLAAVESQLVDLAALRANDWQLFADSRARAMRGLLEVLLQDVRQI